MPHMLPVLRRVFHPNTHSSRESAANLARLATGADVKGVSGVYYEGDKQIKSSTDSYDVAKQEDLWEWTIKNVATDKNEIAKFDIGA